jgi:uncharacterized protein YjdB
LSATVSPSTASNKALTWTSSDNSVATVSNSGVVKAQGKGSATITVSPTDGSGKNAECTVNVKNPCPSGAVDLGLSVYWRTTNIDGGYYAWGETTTKSEFYWQNYKWGTNTKKI